MSGMHATVSSPHHAVDVGLWVRLMDGELSVLVQPAEVYERRPELFRIPWRCRRLRFPHDSHRKSVARQRHRKSFVVGRMPDVTTDGGDFAQLVARDFKRCRGLG